MTGRSYHVTGRKSSLWFLWLWHWEFPTLAAAAFDFQTSLKLKCVRSMLTMRRDSCCVAASVPPPPSSIQISMTSVTKAPKLHHNQTSTFHRSSRISWPKTQASSPVFAGTFHRSVRQWGLILNYRFVISISGCLVASNYYITALLANISVYISWSLDYWLRSKCSLWPNHIWSKPSG